MYIEIDANNNVLGYSDQPSASSIETNEQLPTYTDVQVLKFVSGKFIVEDSQQLTDEKANWIANQYQRDRASQYPSIKDQLDMQYHDQVNGTTTWKDAVAKVKADNPKPT